MFCPKCSQQQVSDEVRFCSRCGFQLGVVKALLADGVPEMPTAEVQASEAQVSDRSQRKRDRTLGAMFMFIFALVVAVVMVDMPSSHSARIILLIIAWMLLTLLINIVPLVRYFFSGDTSSPVGSSGSLSEMLPKFLTRTKTPTTQNPALPPAQSMPATSFARHSANTAEVVPQPQSVTEHTTNLLGNK
ncbi:MAG TPA: zinc ribbon domain-containing protein [Pyrinomonadaceae bacterium]|jgi:predicted nucleic acid-binding Zn ribbon protein